MPQIKLGRSLVGIADFCKDVSDGFLKEIKFISKTSNLQANIFLSEIPLSNHLKKIYNNMKDKKKFGNTYFVQVRIMSYSFLLVLKKIFIKKKKLKILNVLVILKKAAVW